MLSALDGPSYIARVTVDKPAAVRKAKQAIMTAFGRQLDGKGFSLVEVLSPCPTYWRLPPVEGDGGHRELDGQELPVGRIQGQGGGKWQGRLRRNRVEGAVREQRLTGTPARSRRRDVCTTNGKTPEPPGRSCWPAAAGKA